MVWEKMKNWWVSYGFVVMGVMVVNLVLVNFYVVRRGNEAVVSQSDATGACSETCIRGIVAEEMGKELVSEDGDKMSDVVMAKVEQSGECNEECVRIIVAEELDRNNAISVMSKTASVVNTQLRDEYVNLVGGDVKGSEWTRVVGSEKWLDTSLYGDVESVSWQGWLVNPAASGKVYGRLYDLTNGRVVDGSVVVVEDGVKGSFYSENLALWRGQNQYVIELRADSGGEVGIESARIKLLVR